MEAKGIPDTLEYMHADLGTVIFTREGINLYATCHADGEAYHVALTPHGVTWHGTVKHNGHDYYAASGWQHESCASESLDWLARHVRNVREARRIMAKPPVPRGWDSV